MDRPSYRERLGAILSWMDGIWSRTIMCIVTYIPVEGKGFRLTHNRDESLHRKIASPPVLKVINDVEHLYPIDTEGMGTWIGVSATGRVASLMNGGSRPHHHTPPYRHSRGLIIPAYFKYPSFPEFYNEFDFNELEPFTLLVFENGKIYETVLDEDRVEFRTIDAGRPFIYSSTTLYSPASRSRKQDLFFDWYHSTANKADDSILGFHRKHLYENEPSHLKIVDDAILKTVSISSVTNYSDRIGFEYYDLLNDIGFRQELGARRKVINNLS